MHNLVILIAKDFIILPPLLLGYVLIKLPRSEKRRAVLVVIGATILTALLALLGSKLFNDPRPFVAGHFTPYFAHSSDNGFPSDHTLLAGLMAALTYLYCKRLGIFAFAIAALIGASRVIAGVHHISDIIGALVFASVGTYLAQLVIGRFLTKD